MSKKKRKLMCDPGTCDECTYIGEGDFICDRYVHNPERAVVIEDWEPTENYLQCQGGIKVKVISLDYILEYAKKNNCLVQMAELVELADKDGEVVDLQVYQDLAEEKAWNIAKEKIAGKVKQWKKTLVNYIT